jgi:hypothetical protein
MPSDLGIGVLSELEAVFRAEMPAFPFFYMPVLIHDPMHTFVWMSASCPIFKFTEQCHSARGEGLARYDHSVVVRPTAYHWVEFLNELFLGCVAVVLDDRPDLFLVAFHGLFTRLDEGFECEGFSIRAFASVGFAHSNLLDGEPQELKS